MKVKTLLLSFLLFLSCGENRQTNGNKGAPPESIISFAPSVTEILFELGLGDNVRGVTRFCNYPPEAAKKEKVGGVMERNYEMILRLKPDLVIILKEQNDLIPFLDQYKLRYITVGSDSVGEIIESVRAIAKACEVAERGDSLAQGLRLQTRPAATGSVSARPRVLLCIGRDNIGSGAVNGCYAAGALSYYNQLIEIAGGVNALSETRQAYPTIGAEAIVRLDPDIVIDLSHSYSQSQRQSARACGDWNALGTVTAVTEKNVHCPAGDYLTVPGPRLVRTLEVFRSIFSKYDHD